MAAPPSSRFGRGYWLRLVIFTVCVAAVAAAGMSGYLLYRQLDIFINPIRRPIRVTPAEFGLPYEDISLTTGDGLKIAAWYIPGSRPEAIILVHGINANREVMLFTAELLTPAGYPLLLIDMRGHGESDPSQLTYGYREAQDVQAAAAYLAEERGFKEIGVLGTSLGGATVARAAAIEPRLHAVVIQSSYSSLPKAVDDAFDNLSFFPKWPFAPFIVGLAEWQVGVEIGAVNSMRDLAGVAPRPVMIIHGAKDDLFPVQHAYEMYDAAREPKRLWVMTKADHADPALSSEREAYQQQLLSFFAEAFELQ